MEAKALEPVLQRLRISPELPYCASQVSAVLGGIDAELASLAGLTTRYVRQRPNCAEVQSAIRSLLRIIGPLVLRGMAPVDAMFRTLNHPIPSLGHRLAFDALRVFSSDQVQRSVATKWRDWPAYDEGVSDRVS